MGHMAEKQTRRSVSITGFLSDSLRQYAEANDLNVSDIVETQMRKFLGKEPRSVTPRKRHKKQEDAPAQAQEATENPADRRMRILREANVRHEAAGWTPTQEPKKLKKKPFSMVSRMGKRPAKPVIQAPVIPTTASFLVDGQEGVVEEATLES